MRITKTEVAAQQRISRIFSVFSTKGLTLSVTVYTVKTSPSLQLGNEVKDVLSCGESNFN